MSQLLCLNSYASIFIPIENYKVFLNDFDNIMDFLFNDDVDVRLIPNAFINYFYFDFSNAIAIINSYRSYNSYNTIERGFIQRVKKALRNRIVQILAVLLSRITTRGLTENTIHRVYLRRYYSMISI